MPLLQDQWNKVVPKNWPTKPRRHMRPSEIGTPFVDRYYSMMGIEPTNPYDLRTLRIFDTGKIIESLVMRTLDLVGLLHEEQAWVKLPETDKHLGITGRLDATIGGKVDWAAVEGRLLAIQQDDDVLAQKALNIAAALSKVYPTEVPKMIVEVKSINGLAIMSPKNRDEEGNFLGYHHNRLQLLAYLRMTGLYQGYLFYVSKDDYSLTEVPVTADDILLNTDLDVDLEIMSAYYLSKERPPLEPLIVYNDRKAAFELNWNAANSRYLTMLYNFPDAGSMERANHQLILDINRALRHLRTKKIKSEDLHLITEWNLEQYAADPEPSFLDETF